MAGPSVLDLIVCVRLCRFKFHAAKSVKTNLGIICSEMHYGWTSPYLPVLQNGNYTFRITSEESSYLTVIPLIGAIFGAIGAGLIVDKYGRKNLIVFSSIPFIASWLCVALASSSTLMFIGRFVAGVFDGLSFTAVPMYLGEIAEPKTRGLLASVCPVLIVFGILLINILGAYLPLDTVAFISLSWPILLLITFSWMPESPYFYAMKGKIKEARQSLQNLRGCDDVNEELNRILNGVKEQNEKKGHFFHLFSVRSNRKGLTIALGLRGIQQLTGTTAIIFYCKTIFEEAKRFISPSTSTIVYFSVQLILSIFSSFLVDIAGRRPLLIISLTGTGFALLANAIFLYLKNCTQINMDPYDFVPIIALICFIVIFSIGMQTIPLLIMSEIFPTNVKAFSLCLVDIYYSVIVTFISKFFHWSKDAFGLHVPFFAFTICCVFGLIFIIFVVPETKGKTLEDIQRELVNEKRKPLDTKYLTEAKYY